MKAFVAGATGQTGRRVVAELIKRNIPVIAIVRNLEAGQKLLPPEAELAVADVLNPESLQKAIGESTVLICATGAKPSLDITGPYQIDYQGTKNLVNIAKQVNIQHFVLVSSLCVSEFFHPLNLFWLVLYWKKQAEEYLQKSGLKYTIVRPGGLKNEESTQPILMSSADTLFDGSISRTKVAQVCVESLDRTEAANKIVEIVSKPDALDLSWPELFAKVS